MKRINPLAAATLLFICYAIVSIMDMQDTKREDALYCRMVHQWQTTEKSAGWPDYDNKFSAVCNADGTLKEIR